MDRKGQYVYVKAASGLTVRVPRERLGEWQRAQRAMTPEQIERDRQTLAQVRSKLAGG